MTTFAYSFQAARSVLERHTDNVKTIVAQSLDRLGASLRSEELKLYVSYLDSQVDFIERQALPALLRAEQLEAERDLLKETVANLEKVSGTLWDDKERWMKRHADVAQERDDARGACEAALRLLEPMAAHDPHSGALTAAGRASNKLRAVLEERGGEK